jgi:hypothetical protein
MFNDDGLRALAEAAAREETGARGLMTVAERALRIYKFELPGTTVKQFVVNRALVENPQAELERILADRSYETKLIMAELAREFARRFEQRHALKLSLLPDAVAQLIEDALRSNRGMLEHCAEVFKDFEYGLNLVYKNSGQTIFTIDAETIKHPEKKLSAWVVESFKAE